MIATQYLHMNELIESREKLDLFLKNLRERTGKNHKQLEENRYSKVILDPAVSLADYQTYICKLYGVTKACERDVYPKIGSVFSDLEERYKAELIIKDLLGTGISKEKVATLPVHYLDFTTVGEALGVMYVLEGSTLGGKILYKHIHQILGLTGENGASYFWGYGIKTGMLWKNFISTLASYAVENNCEEEIIASAEQTFSSIDKWLNEAEITL